MNHLRDLCPIALFLTVLAAGTASGAAAPEGQMTWGLHFSPTPAWFDPAELASTVASYNTLYALHDAMIRPSPGHPMAPSLAESWSMSPDGLMGEPVVNYLNAIGIRVKLRPIERAAFQKGWIEKKYRGLVQGGNGSFANAATRIESLVVGGGTYVYGSYPDIDGLFREQASELDRKKREAILHHIQQLIYEKVAVAPIWQNVPLNGVGPRVEESGIGLVAGYIYSAPYEDVRLKGK